MLAVAWQARLGLTCCGVDLSRTAVCWQMSAAQNPASCPHSHARLREEQRGISLLSAAASAAQLVEARCRRGTQRIWVLIPSIWPGEMPSALHRSLYVARHAESHAIHKGSRVPDPKP